MMQNPAPAPKARTSGVKITAGTPLKRDINLVSNREAQERLARRGLIFIAALVFLAGFAYFAFYVPLMAGKFLQDRLQNLNGQIAAYSKTDEEFGQLTAQANDLKAMKDSVAASKSSTKSGFDYMKMIESACPSTIRLTDVELTIKDITLTGVADKDADVAQLLVNMQSYPDFTAVTVSNVGPAEAPADATATEAPAPAPTAQGRQFTIVASFPEPPAATATAAPAATPDSKGGSGT